MTIARMPFRQGTARIYRLQTTGSSATVVGTTKLSSPTKRFDGQTAIAGEMVVQPYSRRTDRLGMWPYPQGKAMSASVDVGAYINGVTVSFAKHDRRSRIHTPVAGGQAQPTHPATKGGGEAERERTRPSGDQALSLYQREMKKA